MESGKTSAMVKLMSNDGEMFEVSHAVVMKSKMISYMIEDGCALGVIPIPNVSAAILAKVLKYCKWQVDTEDAKESRSMITAFAPFMVPNREPSTWEKQFLDELDRETLIGIASAADYLNIQDLLDLTCQRVADMMRGNSPEAIRQIFGIVNDYTPEEEEELRHEHQWAFD